MNPTNALSNTEIALHAGSRIFYVIARAPVIVAVLEAARDLGAAMQRHFNVSKQPPRARRSKPSSLLPTPGATSTRSRASTAGTSSPWA